MYEYKCSACGHAFEELVRSEAGADQVACPKCGAPRATRQPSVFAAHATPARSTSRPSGCEQCCDPGGSCPLTD